VAADETGTDKGDGADQRYVVLARKYRPETFADLIGQEAMVTTLKNAFKSNRIAQGYMLTGVRGVGKTTTARILARALNYEKEGFPDGPTVDFEDYGAHCKAIIQSNHPDVIEMDAASNTSVDNVREIIESARYRPLTARYKVFIIDEVHMLSKGAFNALLKTLEEPPEHVKFIFATTEVRRVPVTVLSRCQRFDLRRVDVPMLVEHFARITEKEGASADDDALRLIARAAEGSVRDGLSILDQAIAMGEGKVTIGAVRDMLGLADRGRIYDLLELMLSAKVADTLGAFEALHRDGADPVQVLSDLSEAVHAIARVQAAGPEAHTAAMSAEERGRAVGLAEKLSVPLIARVWQMLLKGLEEAGRAPNPVAASEMVLIRIAYTGDLPTPDEIIKAIGGDTAGRGGPAATGNAEVGAGAGVGASPPTPQPAGEMAPEGPRALARGGGAQPVQAIAQPAERAAPQAAVAAAQPVVALKSFEDVLALCSRQRDIQLRMHLEDHVSLVSFQPGRIEVFPLEAAPKGLAGDLGRKLCEWTGERWVVSVGREMGDKPVGEVIRAKRQRRIEEAARDPAVAPLLEAFPDAKIIDVSDGPASGE
jgi:DNA polymerase-3 subunit gamma/tau